MSHNNNKPWDLIFVDNEALFSPIRSAAKFFHNCKKWPTLNNYQALLDLASKQITSEYGRKITIVPQDKSPTSFDTGYEPRVYLRGEVQTRINNWHDFFQVLIWRTLPITKSTINARHYIEAKTRVLSTPVIDNRGRIENALALFDECGAIVVSTNPELLSLLKDKQWKTLFWDKRMEVEKNLECFIFGHALYEKALHPYPGMTAHCILLDINPTFLNLNIIEKISRLDELVAKKCQEIENPKQLTPLPILGIPGWSKNNNNEAYYDDTRYFRPG